MSRECTDQISTVRSTNREGPDQTGCQGDIWVRCQGISNEQDSVKTSGSRPCYQNAWWTVAKENPLWRTTSWKTFPWWSEEAIQRQPSKPPLQTSTCQLNRGNRLQMVAQSGEALLEGVLVSAKQKESANPSGTCSAKSQSYGTSSDLSCSICNRQFRAEIISHQLFLNTQTKTLHAFHYENTPIQIYRKFYLQTWKFSDKKLRYFFRFLHKT